MKELVNELPSCHYHTLGFLMKHLTNIAVQQHVTKVHVRVHVYMYIYIHWNPFIIGHHWDQQTCPFSKGILSSKCPLFRGVRCKAFHCILYNLQCVQVCVCVLMLLNVFVLL